jgi:hypothetical protein
MMNATIARTPNTAHLRRRRSKRRLSDMTAPVARSSQSRNPARRTKAALTKTHSAGTIATTYPRATGLTSAGTVPWHGGAPNHSPQPQHQYRPLQGFRLPSSPFTWVCGWTSWPAWGDGFRGMVTQSSRLPVSTGTSPVDQARMIFLWLHRVRLAHGRDGESHPV